MFVNKEVPEFKVENQDSFGDFHALPRDLLILIFSQLAAPDIEALRGVSKGS
jgi:hypothetical protein